MMKKRTLTLLMAVVAGLGVNSAFKMVTMANDVSFYKVPLVCSAAPELGCGSRSKPVLLALEKSEVIKEAWLNKQGNVIAVVWTENSTIEDRRDAAIKEFKAHKVNASELLIFDLDESLDSFSIKDGWYSGEDVNLLSKEEAGIFADRLLVEIKEKTDLNSADVELLKDEIQEIFYDFFINFESMEELGDPEVYKDKLAEVVKSGEKYVGAGNMPSVDELWQVCSEGTGHSSDCCKSGSSCKVRG